MMTIIFLLVTELLFAPMLYVLDIEEVQPICSYDALIRAVVAVESGGDASAYNQKENAVGAFQIRQIRVDHYNQLTGKNYSLADMFDYEISKEIFIYFAQREPTFEAIARRWNGSGTATDIYWEQVKAQLNKL